MRERIMKAFVEQIQEHGMKFTMDHLARVLGISKRTLYEYFSSKVEILDSIILDSLAEVDEKTEEIIQDSSLSLLEKIKQVIAISPSLIEFYDVRILEQMKRYYPEQWEKVNTALSDWEALRRLLKQGIAEGEIVDLNVELMIKVIIEATNCTFDQRFFMKNNISVQEALASVVNILLYGLVPDKKRVDIPATHQ